MCWDRDEAESFFLHVKTGVNDRNDFVNHVAPRTAAMEYIESKYNRRRTQAYNHGPPQSLALAEFCKRLEASINLDAHGESGHGK